MAKPVLKIIVASTRPVRAGAAVADWLVPVARAHGGFTVEVLDLAVIRLPMMEEPNHPRFASYTFDHTKAWSATIAAADAFVIVMPEYNYAFNAPLKNALDYLFVEWQHKPVGLVSYGGVSGGLRAAQMIKQVLTTLSMMPIVEAVPIPMVGSLIVDGVLKPNELMDGAASAMLDSLVRWTSALSALRHTVEDDAGKDV